MGRLLEATGSAVTAVGGCGVEGGSPVAGWVGEQNRHRLQQLNGAAVEEADSITLGQADPLRHLSRKPGFKVAQ